DKMWLGGMTMDPLSGTVVSEELGRLEHELFEAEWAEVKARLGREPTVADLDRTPGQRRCDALAEMAKRSRTAPANGKRPAPLITVLVDFPTLAGRVCELANGTVVPPGALLSLLDEAYIERAVFSPDKRVEVSETARLFTGATRRAIELRDRSCTHPYCDRPASACQADHIIPYAEGGPTTQENGRLLCAFHNRLRNQPGVQRPPPDG
ncbi:MAG TPA: HNH endonuclease signature motif containing protein, partial [Acidimicrobiales bacterium]